MIQAALRQAESLFDHLQVQNRAPRHVGRLVVAALLRLGEILLEPLLLLLQRACIAERSGRLRLRRLLAS